jgi:hypothetical protein
MPSLATNHTTTTTARIGISEFTKNPRRTYFLITGIVALIGLIHLLPPQTQLTLAQQFKQNKWLVAIVLIACLALTYFNWIAGLLVLFLAICVLFPITLSDRIDADVEGFTSNSNTQNKSVNDISLNNKHIQSLFEPGLLGKRVAEYRETNKRIKAENAAREKNIKIMNAKRSAKLGSKNKGRQNEEFREIELRRFDPTNEEDMNLILTMEHCADIQNRIKYVYEDNKYLKKYIREKLEDIVDLLDLVPADDN